MAGLEKVISSENLQTSNLSRRDMLKLASVGGLWLFLDRVKVRHAIDAFTQQADDWGKATLSNDEFISQEQATLKNTKIGCSFAPELFGKPEKTLESLNIIARELLIKDIRLGIRWNRVARKDDRIDLSFYKPTIDYCLDRGVNLCLNIGPIKTFRWEEEHVPEHILRSLPIIPPYGAVIDTFSELSKKSVDYTDDLLYKLKGEYSNTANAPFPIIQPENEALFNFGKNGWTMDYSHIKNIIQMTSENFPSAKILLNSAGSNNLEQIAALFSSLSAEERYKDKLILGIDYYYKTPSLFLFLRKLADPITQSVILENSSYNRNRVLSKKIGYDLEVTEAQGEPWYYITSPGNSVEEFRFLIKRSTENILSPNSGNVIRYWGIEYLTNNLLNHPSPDQKQIADLIIKINSLGN